MNKMAKKSQNANFDHLDHHYLYFWHISKVHGQTSHLGKTELKQYKFEEKIHNAN